MFTSFFSRQIHLGSLCHLLWIYPERVSVWEFKNWKRLSSTLQSNTAAWMAKTYRKLLNTYTQKSEIIIIIGIRHGDYWQKWANLTTLSYCIQIIIFWENSVHRTNLFLNSFITFRRISLYSFTIVHHENILCVQSFHWLLLPQPFLSSSCYFTVHFPDLKWYFCKLYPS